MIMVKLENKGTTRWRCNELPADLVSFLLKKMGNCMFLHVLVKRFGMALVGGKVLAFGGEDGTVNTLDR